jgi:hypothetical protein
MSPRRAPPQKKKASSGLPSWLIVAAVAVLVIVVVIVGADFIGKAMGSAPVAPVTGISTTGRTKGDPNAKVAFLEFSDFQ